MAAVVLAVSINATTIIKYYYFNGIRLAVRKGSTFSYLHNDHLGSTVLATHTSGGVITSQEYYAFGRKRGDGTTLPIDYRFTGQKLDTTGLMYYNARYYDPTIGKFISPDTIVPDPTNMLDYNGASAHFVSGICMCGGIRSSIMIRRATRPAV